MRTYLTFAFVLALAACGKPVKPSHFSGTQPDFDPLAFWTGHRHSWGVLENSRGEPTDTVQTDCIGVADGPNSLHMLQTLTLGDGTVQHRDWHMHRTGPGHFTATANDMQGTAEGQAFGRVFHWRWQLTLSPGTSWKIVIMDQWMYAMPGDTMMNRTTIKKLGIVIAAVSEQFYATP